MPTDIDKAYIKYIIYFIYIYIIYIILYIYIYYIKLYNLYIVYVYTHINTHIYISIIYIALGARLNC